MRKSSSLRTSVAHLQGIKFGGLGGGLVGWLVGLILVGLDVVGGVCECVCKSSSLRTSVAHLNGWRGGVVGILEVGGLVGFGLDVVGSMCAAESALCAYERT